MPEHLMVSRSGLYCLGRHFTAFYAQCRAEAKAGFAEPCVACPVRMAGECKSLDWYGNIKPVLAAAGVPLNIVFGQSRIGGADSATGQFADCGHSSV